MLDIWERKKKKEKERQKDKNFKFWTKKIDVFIEFIIHTL